SGFVYLPFLFAAFGLMISRSFVRSMPVSFRRTDWLVYSVRAFEFSALMHAAAVLWHLLAAIAALGGRGPGSPVLHLIDAVVCVCFVVVSLFGRTALLSRPAVTARASGVVSGLIMVVVGFLDVIVNSFAMAAGAGLVTGGAALALGLAIALMLTVPAPVRDEFGAPDVTRRFADFRARDGRRRSLLDQVPDVTAETAPRKTIPSRSPTRRHAQPHRPPHPWRTMFRWTLHGDGRTIAPDAIVRPEERLAWPLTIGIGAQHVIAMFGATFLVPVITGFPPSTTLLFSGIGTLLFLLITQNKV